MDPPLKVPSIFSYEIGDHVHTLDMDPSKAA